MSGQLTWVDVSWMSKWSFAHLPGFLLKPVITKVNIECGVKEGGLWTLPKRM